ncbi:MAG: DUF892 family protein [Flavisolibacter sp.]|jgi:ferritin-like metal-binding protein YciE
MESRITDTFIKQLQLLWSVESMLMEEIPRIMAKATNMGLQKTLAYHLAETDQHKVAIEGICKMLDINAKGGEPNSELLNIIHEGEKAMLTQVEGNHLDAAIIFTALVIEQYEISVYGMAAETAESLGYTGIAKRLRLTLAEEQQSENKLKYLESALFQNRADIGYNENKESEQGENGR